MSTTTASNIDAPTQFLNAGNETYAYRRFGGGHGLQLLFLQHFTGNLDNWDRAVTDVLAAEREVILFDNVGVGRSSGSVPNTIEGMAKHALAFLDGLGIEQCNVLGFSLGGMVAQQMVLDRPSIFQRMILVGTAPRGGEDIMRLDKPALAVHFGNPDLKGYEILQKVFFTPSRTGQEVGAEFIERLMQRRQDRDPQSGNEVIQAHMASFREWEQPHGERFADLKGILQPTLIVNGVNDEMISVRNSYALSENLPNCMLLIYSDAGHGSLFQYHQSFTKQVGIFLDPESPVTVRR